MFKTPLEFEEVGTGDLVRLTAPLVWNDIVIPEGFLTDFYSVRCVGKLIVPRRKDTEEARKKLAPSVLHDYGFVVQEHSRAEVDAMFLEAMKEANVFFDKTIWLAVRIGGWPAWNKNKRLREEDLESFLKSYGL